MISTKLNIAKSNNSIPTWGIPFPFKGVKALLSSGVTQSTTVPPDVNVAIFGYSAGSNVQVDVGSSESLPIGGFQPTQSRINPTAAWVNPGEVLNFITPDANAYVYVAFYTNEERS